MTITLDRQTIDPNNPEASFADQSSPSPFIWTDDAFLHRPDGDRLLE